MPYRRLVRSVAHGGECDNTALLPGRQLSERAVRQIRAEAAACLKGPAMAQTNRFARYAAPMRLNCSGVIEKCFLKVLQKCAVSLKPVS